MEESSSSTTRNSTPPAADPKALLAAANSASEKVAALHIVFLAICAYILVIVFGTTDVDLLIGKGVKLPVVDVEVPIVGFYGLAPYLLVIIHFNLLLALQLLSQKLYAFDDAARRSEDITGLQDQLNIFPYNHYLIGDPGRLIGGFLALVITITMLLLPLAALLTLQARFLAYQSEGVTWLQRLAVWLDVGLVAVFWPVIMDRRDSWKAFMGGVWQHARHHWLRWLWGAAGLIIAFSLLAREVTWRTTLLPPPLVPESKEYLAWLTEPWLFKVLIAWLVFGLFARPLRHCARRLSGGRYFLLQDGRVPFVLGASGLLAIVSLGLLLPLILVTAGETLDRPAAFSTLVLASLRHLNLREKVLVARPLPADTLADLLSGDSARVENALKSVQRVDLRNRSLRRADLSNALLPKADLRYARLQDAQVVNAYLQGADFTGAQLEGTIFFGDSALSQLPGGHVDSVHLEGTNFQGAQLRGTFFVGAMLNGANLSKADLRGTIFTEVSLEKGNFEGAQMQGTVFDEVQLQGANLSRAQLQGTSLYFTYLQETNFTEAQLQGASFPRRLGYLAGANFSKANLQSANLSGAWLQGANFQNADLHGGDLSGAHLQGADLNGAELGGANMQGAALYTASSPYAPALDLIDARGLKWDSLSTEELRLVREVSSWRWLSKENQSRYEAAIEETALPGLKAPQFRSCLRDSKTQVTCDNDLSLVQTSAARLQQLDKLNETLEKLACGSEPAARYYIGIPNPPKGLASRLLRRINLGDAKSCPGLAQFSPKDKALLSNLVSKEEAPRDQPLKDSPPAANGQRR